MSLEWMSPLVNLGSLAAGRGAGASPDVAKIGVGVEKACREFEAYFTASLFSEMTKTLEIGENQGVSGQQESWMWSLAGQTVAQELSRGEGLGLKQQLLPLLTKNLGTDAGRLD
jgi:Rod binding domain-containing protein